MCIRYRGTLLTRNAHPPQDHDRALGIVLLPGPRRGVFLMSEVPLCQVSLYVLQICSAL